MQPLFSAQLSRAARAQNASRNAYSCHIWQDRFEQDTSCTYDRAPSNFDVAQNRCTSRNERAIPYLRMQVPLFLAGSSQGDLLKNRHIVADDYPRAMVDEDTPAYHNSGMDIYTKEPGNPALQQAR